MSDPLATWSVRAASAADAVEGTWRSHACSDCVTAIAATGDAVWAGTLSGGVIRMDARGASARRFTTQEGMSGNHIYALAASPDGQVWVATRATTVVSALSGVSQWDGRRWTVHADTASLPAASVRCMAAGPRGSAVLAYENAIARFDGAAWRVEEPADVLPSGVVTAVAVGADGAAWAGTDRGVARHDGTAWHAVPTSELSSQAVRALAVEVDGSLWALLGDRNVASYRSDGWPDGRLWQVHTPPGNAALDRVFVADDAVWAAGGSRVGASPWTTEYDVVHRLDDRGWASVDIASIARDARRAAVSISPTGEVWVGTLGHGMVVVRDGTAEWISVGLGITGVTGRAIAVDGRGLVWAGTVNPSNWTIDSIIDHFDGTRWVRHSEGEGMLRGDRSPLGIASNGIDADAAGRVWLALEEVGVARLDGAVWSTWTITDVLGSAGRIRHVAVDERGGAWVSSAIGAAHYDNGAWRRYKAADGLGTDSVQAIGVDHRSGADAVWFCTDRGLVSRIGATWESHGVLAEVGCFDLFVDARDGTVWFSGDNGIVWFDGVAARTFELPGTRAWSIAQAPDGAVWAAVAGTDNGVLRYDGTGWTTYTARDGLPDDVGYDVDVGTDGTVWVATLGGVGEFVPRARITPAPSPTEEPTATVTPPPSPTASPPADRAKVFFPLVAHGDA